MLAFRNESLVLVNLEQEKSAMGVIMLLAFVFLLCLIALAVCIGVGANAELRRIGILYTLGGVGMWVLAVLLDACLIYFACLEHAEFLAFLLVLSLLSILCAIIPWPREWGGLDAP